MSRISKRSERWNGPDSEEYGRRGVNPTVTRHGDDVARKAAKSRRGGRRAPGPSPGARRLAPMLDAALAHHRAGNLGQAERGYRAVLELDPEHPDALHLLGVVAHQGDYHREAESFVRRAIAVDRRRPAFHNSLGEVLRAQAKLDQAIAAYRVAVRLDPRYADAHGNLGLALAAARRTAAAIESLERAVRLNRTFAPGHLTLGNLLRDGGHLEDAVDAYRNAIDAAPALVDAYIQLGGVLRTLGRNDDEAQCYEALLQKVPEAAQSLNRLGTELIDEGRADEAVETLRAALRLAPDYAHAHGNLGVALMNQGRVDDARQHFHRALELDAYCVEVYEDIARSRRFDTEDRAEIVRIEALVDDPKIDESGRISLHFALGKMHDDCGDFDQAFAHYRAANQLKRKSLTFDRAQYEAWVNAIQATFDNAYFARRHDHGCSSELPILIVGMPRSGTSLVEQIIASHPQAFGGDELSDIDNFTRRLPHTLQTTQPYPACAAMLDRANAIACADEYTRHLRALGGEALRVTDKMPANFFHLGFVAAVLPRARIVHCRRDALDVCLSIYFQRFVNGNAYAYDLSDIGAFYRGYEKLMNHWRAVLPAPMFELDYERLVENPAEVSRELIEHCGLPWDDRCLEFHTNRRAVGSASNWQVRQPVYTGSVKRWTRYEQHLGELKRALGRERE